MEDCTVQNAIIDQLREELNESKKDAARYRWLTEHKHIPWISFLDGVVDLGIDAAIDAAMTPNAGIHRAAEGRPVE